MQQFSNSISFTSCSPKSFRRAANNIIKHSNGLTCCNLKIEERLKNAVTKGLDKTTREDNRLNCKLQGICKKLNIQI